MKKYTYLLILFFAGYISLQAQSEVRFVIDVPNTVVQGAQFHLTYILEGGRGSEFEVEDNIAGFDVLYGPALSQSSSTTIVNGKMTSRSSMAYTYTLLAKEEGTFSMPIASVTVEGRSYKSNSVKVKVLPPDKNAAQQQQGRSQPQITNPTSTAEKVSADDVFVRAIFSKTKVNEQEPVQVTFKLYSALDIRGFVDAKFPEFEGFLVEDIEIPANRQIGTENYKGRNYYTIDIKKTLLFPQKSGTLTIPSGSVTIVLIVPSGREVVTFFGRQRVMTDTEKTLRTSPVTVNVSKLPEGKSLDFSGGVGAFSLKSSITSQHVKANEAITLKIDITGQGNMKLLKNPQVNLPKDFEAYDPKVNNNFKVTTSGYSGTKSIEYLFIPRYYGKYTIPEIEFSYFDTSSRSYKTLKTSAYDIEVDKDPNAGSGQTSTSYINQQQVQIEQDIRYVKTGEVNLQNHSEYLTGSLANILWYLVPFILFVGALIAYRKQIKENADIARMKTKKANKVAARRLKQANKYLKNNEKDKFYEESLRAVWGYLSDKLTIPVSELNRENIESELNAYGVEGNLISEFISVLDICEFARYAPSESEKAMDNIYSEMVSIIDKMENVIKIK